MYHHDEGNSFSVTIRDDPADAPVDASGFSAVQFGSVVYFGVLISGCATDQYQSAEGSHKAASYDIAETSIFPFIAGVMRKNSEQHPSGFIRRGRGSRITIRATFRDYCVPKMETCFNSNSPPLLITAKPSKGSS